MNEFEQRFKHCLGEEGYHRRRAKEITEERKLWDPRHFIYNIRTMRFGYLLLQGLLWCTGLLSRGRLNSISYNVVEHEVPLTALPREFDGFRVLHISDLHADGLHDAGKALIEKINGLSFDLAVITGDFRFFPTGAIKSALEATEGIAEALKCEHGIYAVLGNHDVLGMIPLLQQMNVNVLLNEGVSISRAGEEILLAGIDDMDYFRTGDTKKALGGASRDKFSILLSHSPDAYIEAQTEQVNLFLAGHTHGGQICLPGGLPLQHHAQCPRALSQGRWTHGTMVGYTSPGTGSSGLGVRFFCPPEITVHVLRRAAN
jgi:predicted MPP superfamily phosphohydrolase